MPNIVIARYNEDINWILDIPSSYKVYLYNKGNKDIPEAVLSKIHKYIELENVGRESDTYLLHMLCAVEDEDTFTVFTQGAPFEHCANFIDLLSYEFSGDVWGYSSQWKAGYPPAPLIQNYLEKTQKPTRNEVFSLYHWGPIYSFDEGAFRISLLYSQHFLVPNGTNIAASFLSRIGYHSLSTKAAEATLGEFSYGAIFGVRNKAILAVEREVLINALTFVRSLAVAGYIMERLWLHLFNHPFLPFDHVRAGGNEPDPASRQDLPELATD